MPDVAPPSPFHRAAALGLSAALGAGLTLAVRGTAIAYGLLGHADAAPLPATVAALLVSAAAVGVCAPLVAGNHVPGLPLRALCVAWAGIAVSLRPVSGATTPLTYDYWRVLAVSEVLLLAVCALVTTTACWLVDTRITFPRRYPDPGTRPAAKHTTPRAVAAVLLPHALGVGIGLAALYTLTAQVADPTLAILLVAIGTAFLARGIQRAFPARGSIWTMVGVLAGVAGGVWFSTPATALPLPETRIGVAAHHVLACAVAGYAALAARNSAGGPRHSTRRPLLARDPDDSD